MPYRRTAHVVSRLAARYDAILKAAQALAAEGGMAAVQIAPVAECAGIAAGTVYRYFPAKTELVAALVAALAETEMAALARAGEAAPGPLSSLVAVIMTFATRSLAQRRLAVALLVEPAEPEIDAARAPYRATVVRALEDRIRTALSGGHLPAQDAALAAPALVGALIEGLIGPLAPIIADDAGAARARAQALALLALRALGVVDARARGLVVQARVPDG
jgi:AcrR family transcriptional regulator